ncbi:MAG: UDP-N-acetylglucosamine 1-carboxyvinyltransferase [Elusimicrobiales bacterium]|jgi:UDP-N-acetylglucosamine 1-carboxyvinyltransferase|nr:UDP-N-acetylglucosamine 1-carboxyvinyltransferase [Elusimicrobiales bacterium]NLH38486.1 UDP-N-acetylglucosamine 1-carboxyvinyltransferase [Elusimicrobiota bacterium]
MDSFIIEGGSKICGSVKISGSKNSSLPILFSTVLTDERCVINNVPELMDIKTTYELLSYCGKTCFFGFNSFSVDEKNKIITEAPYDLVRKMRASVLIAGPMLARFKHVKFSMPGGCAIGVRPIDIHLDGFKKFGADVKLDAGYVILSAKKLKPAVISLKFPSVGATENIMMLASLVEGKSVIKNAAKEPEISDLACVLNKMGARVSGAGSNEIVVEGSEKLKGFEHNVIPDRIEAGTFLILTALCGGRLELLNVESRHIETLLKKLEKTGAILEVYDNRIVISSGKKILPSDIKTEPYPGYPTDLQAQWTSYMSVADGKSMVVENIFENRFMHVAELIRMGADIEIKHNTVIINGVKNLKGATVMASDLRAGAGLILAGARAQGITKVRRVYHIDRGYEKIELKLLAAGVKIKRIVDE